MSMVAAVIKFTGNGPTQSATMVRVAFVSNGRLIAEMVRLLLELLECAVASGVGALLGRRH